MAVGGAEIQKKKFRGGTPEVRKDMRALRKASSATTPDAAAVTAAKAKVLADQKANAAKVGVGPNAQSKLRRLRNTVANHGMLTVQQEASLRRLTAVSQVAAKAESRRLSRDSTPSGTESGAGGSAHPELKVSDAIAAYKNSHPMWDATGGGGTIRPVKKLGNPTKV